MDRAVRSTRRARRRSGAPSPARSTAPLTAQPGVAGRNLNYRAPRLIAAGEDIAVNLIAARVIDDARHLHIRTFRRPVDLQFLSRAEVAVGDVLGRGRRLHFADLRACFDHLLTGIGAVEAEFHHVAAGVNLRFDQQMIGYSENKQ